jgi:hypothetical protein
VKGRRFRAPDSARLVLRLFRPVREN